MASRRSTPENPEAASDSTERFTRVGASGRPAREIVLHATCVAIDGRGVVLTGPSGSGKSALGLQLIDGGAMLIADDVTAIYQSGKRLIARAPQWGAGLIEARGNGMMRLPYADQAPITFFVELGTAEGERLPEMSFRTELDVAVPKLRADARDPAAAALIRLAVQHGPPHIPEEL